MKLLFVCSDKYPPRRVDVGILFARELASKGHTIHWVMQSDKVCPKPYETDWHGGRAWVGPTVEKRKRSSRIRQQLLNLQHDIKLLKLLFCEKYDFIQVKDKVFPALLSALFAKLRRVKFFYWLSYPFPEAKLYSYKMRYTNYPLINFLRGHLYSILLYKMIMPMADHVFCQSRQMKIDIENQGVAKEKVTPVPMGFSSEMVNLQDVDQKGAIKSVAYVGTIIRERKMDFLVRSFKYVLDKVPDAVLHIVGGGEGPEDLEFLENEVKRHGLEKSVQMTGLLERGQALKYIQRAHVCVSPFYPTPILNSTSPTKVIEYMAFSRPVVANDHPEQKLLIEESGGGLCTPYEEAPFADAIVKILQNPELGLDMGKMGQAYAFAHREYGIIASHLEHQYKHLLKKG